MKRLKRIYRMIAIVIMLSVLSPSMLPISDAAVAEAATTIKISKKTLTLEVGKSSTLKITGTKSKVTWSSSSKTVATVSTAGKVTAKKVGTATVTATVNKKKYTCKVTVKAPVNPYITNAPFSAQEAVFGKFNMVFPKDWTHTDMNLLDNMVLTMLYPSSADTVTSTSNINVQVLETGEDALEYDLLKESFEVEITEEYLVELFASAGLDTVISDYTISDLEVKLGTAFVVEYKLTYMVGSSEGVLYQKMYNLNLDNYMIVVTTTDVGDDVSPDLYEVAEYLLNSIQAVK